MKLKLSGIEIIQANQAISETWQDAGKD